MAGIYGREAPARERLAEAMCGLMSRTDTEPFISIMCIAALHCARHAVWYSGGSGAGAVVWLALALALALLARTTADEEDEDESS